MSNFSRAYNSISSKNVPSSSITKRLSSGTETLKFDQKSINNFIEDTVDGTENQIMDMLNPNTVKSIPSSEIDDNLRRILRGMPTQAELSRQAARQNMPGKSFNQMLDDLPTKAQVDQKIAQNKWASSNSSVYTESPKYENHVKDLTQYRTDGIATTQLPTVKEVDNKIGKTQYQREQGFLKAPNMALLNKKPTALK